MFFLMKYIMFKTAQFKIKFLYVLYILWNLIIAKFLIFKQLSFQFIFLEIVIHHFYIYIFQDYLMNRKFKKQHLLIYLYLFIWLFDIVHAKKLDFFYIKTLL